MGIKYESTDFRCITKCPFGKEKYGVGMSVGVVFVGSMACAACEHFVSIDNVSKIVICNADQQTE